MSYLYCEWTRSGFYSKSSPYQVSPRSEKNHTWESANKLRGIDGQMDRHGVFIELITTAKNAKIEICNHGKTLKLSVVHVELSLCKI